jgi:hypothetical protein
MNKCHLDHSTAEKLGYDFFRVNNDVNGNPRYVIHYMAFLPERNSQYETINDLTHGYETARQVARSLGFRKYTGKDFGGGFVGMSYNLENEAEAIIEAREAIQ